MKSFGDVFNTEHQKLNERASREEENQVCPHCRSSNVEFKDSKHKKSHDENMTSFWHCLTCDRNWSVS